MKLLNKESYCLRVQYKLGGIFHRRLNINEKPIVNKYCEGKLKRTLKKEFKEFEVVNLESIYYTAICEAYASNCLMLREH